MKPRLLVAEDHQPICDALEVLLEDRYDVTSVSDGAQALARLSAERFDLLLCDVLLPLVPAAELVPELRRRGVTLPIVLMSGHPGALEVAAGLGADASLVKPFDPERLERLLEALLAR